MLTFITGAPGSGKTLYTITKLLAPVVGTTVTGDRDVLDSATGLPIEHPRTIYTNIKGLLIDHELIDDAGLNTWHEWAKPGSIICYDEVQKPWPPRPNGSKVPEYIQHLETHRHMGVDFIVMTQHPLLVDRNLVNLVGRHLHIRRIANMALAVVYEWDHASKSLLYKNSITKAPWRYDKKVFKLYRSADLHTKQPRRIPGLIWFLLVGICAAIYLFPTFYQRFTNRVAGGTAQASNEAINGSNTGPLAQVKGAGGSSAKNGLKAVSNTPQAALDEYLLPTYPRIDGLPWTAPRYDHLTEAKQVPVITGCVDQGTKFKNNLPRYFCQLRGGMFVYPPVAFIQKWLKDGGYFYDFEVLGRESVQGGAGQTGTARVPAAPSL